MPSVIFTEAYDVVPALLVDARRRAGVSQRELARRMGRCPSHIGKIEARQRRVEIIEFCRYAEALGEDPARLFEELRRRLRLAGAEASTSSPGSATPSRAARGVA